MRLKKRMTEEELRQGLNDICTKHGKQKEFANKIGVSQSYFCDLLQGKRGFGETIANALGYERIVIYKKKEE